MTIARYLILLCAIMVLCFSSCTVEKRVYMQGYHVEWMHIHHRDKVSFAVAETKTPTEAVNEKAEAGHHNSRETMVSMDKEENPPSVLATTKDEIMISKKPIAVSQPNDDDCDVIVLMNGQEISAKVFEVGAYEIRYKECGNPNGPTFVKNTAEVFMIKYPNGSSSVINPRKVPASNPGTTEGKSQITALILCLFVGIFGIHRFYLGYTGIGILYLFTAGLCGIGCLVDLIMLCTGNLRPKNGDYTETF